ncbi:hypothetical protein [Diaminobutyricimonas sp. LJ205]|uniref:hypothetical protein n=1 Tax=Diaminobutyricimonas sp. LJ205 TaxID=2683590 RepID=UPI0012F4BD06|nr:hypothetical protein [Diaminobutyricimonas sp. LJ205]
MKQPRRRRWPWLVAGAIVAALLIVIAVIAVPILTHQNAGASGQQPFTEDWPTAATGEGEDGRDRSIEVMSAEPGGPVDTSALAAGDRLVVSGSGFDASRGIYVAICVIPEPGGKPGPCLGGVPSTEEGESFEEGSVQFAPSNWINDDWAWRLFGARSYDDAASGTFTAYLEVPAPVGEGIDCREQDCGIFTRNDHTAAGDRVQDLYVPVAFR